MGSSQSAATVDSSVGNSLQSSTSGEVSREKKKRVGIDAVNYKCRKTKSAYDKCASEWYNGQFLKGRSINQEEECGSLFESYRQCYLKGIKREYFDKGKKKPKEGSILAEELPG